jgi:hypothetical protein
MIIISSSDDSGHQFCYISGSSVQACKDAQPANPRIHGVHSDRKFLSYDACSVSKKSCSKGTGAPLEKVGLLRIIGDKQENTNGRFEVDGIVPDVLETTTQNFSDESKNIGSSEVVTEIINNIKDQSKGSVQPQQVEAFQTFAAAIGGDLSSLDSTDKPEDEFVSSFGNDDSLKVGVSGIKSGIARTARINQESRLEVDSRDHGKVGVSSIVDPIAKHIASNHPESDGNIEAFQKFAAAIGGDLHSFEESHVEADKTKALKKFVAAFGGDPTAIEDFIKETRKEEETHSFDTPDKATFKVGLAGLTDSLARTARINQESRSDVEIQVGSKTGVSGIIEPIFEHLEKQNKKQKFETTSARVGLISDSIIQRLETAQQDDNLSGAGGIENQKKNDGKQRFEAQGIIREVLHAIKGYHIEKPHKASEVEQFGDKIRVRVNRVKERAALKTTYVDQDIPLNLHL